MKMRLNMLEMQPPLVADALLHKSQHWRAALMSHASKVQQ
jgi:hypothetical protein